jgi:hypothetical protein
LFVLLQDLAHILRLNNNRSTNFEEIEYITLQYSKEAICGVGNLMYNGKMT